MKRILLSVILLISLFVPVNAQIFGEIGMYRAYFFELGQDLKNTPLDECKYSLIKKGKEVEILDVDPKDIYHAKVRYKDEVGLIHISVLKDRYVLLPFIPQIRPEYVPDMKRFNAVLGMNEEEVGFMCGVQAKKQEYGDISHWSYSESGISFDFYKGKLCKMNRAQYSIKGYSTLYDLQLSKVELSGDIGSDSIISVELPDKKGSEFAYEDDFIKITWTPEDKFLRFAIENKSNSNIKLPWDDMSFVAMFGNSERVINGETRNIEVNREQQESIIPRGARFSATAFPYSKKRIIQKEYICPEEADDDGKSVIGEEIRILFPVKVEDATNEYLFIFQVKDVSIIPYDEEAI